MKIAPDLSDEEICAIAAIVKSLNVEGIIATNTTTRRDIISASRLAQEAGGLSGVPLRSASTHVIATLYRELGDDIPIVGVGGINDATSAREKIDAGAKLIQIYTGFIYQGWRLITEAADAIASAYRSEGTG